MRILLLLGILSLAPAGALLPTPAEAAQTTTPAPLVIVRLKSGDGYLHVRVRLNREYMVLAVRDSLGHVLANVPLDQIDSIIDASGADITASVLEGPVPSTPAPSPPAPSTPAPESPYPRTLAPPPPDRYDPWGRRPVRYRSYLPWKFGITLGGGFGVPSGDWFAGTDGRADGNATVTIGLSREFALDIGYQYQPLEVRRGVLDELASGLVGPSGGPVHVDEDFAVHEIVVGPRFLAKQRGSPLWGYLAAGFGMYGHATRVRFSSDGATSESSDLTWKAGDAIYGGGIYMFTPSLGACLDARWDFVFADTGDSRVFSGGGLFHIGAGVVFGL